MHILELGKKIFGSARAVPVENKIVDIKGLSVGSASADTEAESERSVRRVGETEGAAKDTMEDSVTNVCKYGVEKKKV